MEKKETKTSKIVTEEEALDNYFKIKNSVTLYTFQSTVGFIGGMGLGGYGLDYLLQTKPLFLIISLIISFPLNIWNIYRKIKQESK